MKVIYYITVFLLLLSISVDANLIKPKLIWEKTFSSQIMKVCERKDIDMLKGQKAKFPLSAVMTKKDLLVFNLRGKVIKKISLQGYDQSSISNDGNTIAAMKGREITVFSSHNEIINKIDIAEPQPVVLPQYITFEVSPNGQYIVIISWFSKQIYFYAVNGKLLATHQFKDLRKTRVLFSKDSSTVLIHVPNFGDGSSHGFLTCFNMAGELLWRFDHEGCEAEVDVSVNGKNILLADQNKIYSFNENGQILFSKKSKNKIKISISDNGKFIAIVDKSDFSISLLDNKYQNIIWKKYTTGFNMDSLLSSLDISKHHVLLVLNNHWSPLKSDGHFYSYDLSGNQIVYQLFSKKNIRCQFVYNDFIASNNNELFLYRIDKNINNN